MNTYKAPEYLLFRLTTARAASFQSWSSSLSTSDDDILKHAQLYYIVRQDQLRVLAD